jgi:hypothetical protein
MKYLLVITLLLVAFTVCHSQGNQNPGIPGLRSKAVMERISREMVTSTEWDGQRYQTSMKSYRDGLDFNVAIKGPLSEGPVVDSDDRHVGPGVITILDSLLSVAGIDTVLVELRTNPEVGDVIDSQQYLIEMCTIPYKGSDVQRAEDWLREVFMHPESRTTIGPVEFILRAPSAYERELILRHASVD